MGENTSISWARHTFNSWIGCTKVSPACKNCYAERDWDHRFHRVKWGPKGARSVTGPDTWRKPRAWDRAAAAAGERHTVFSNSLSDVMDDHPSIQLEWRRRQWELIGATPNLEWLLLTKRPENWFRFLPDWQRPMPNVRLGVSIEDQEWADIRAPHLKSAKMNGWKTFVSYGPACGPVDWDAILPFIDWLVAEGESGPDARPTHPDWFRQAADACGRHDVPFHLKQLGEWCDPVSARIPTSAKAPFLDQDGWPLMVRTGAEAAGRLLDGVLHDAFPA